MHGRSKEKDLVLHYSPNDRYNYDWCTQSDIEACTGVKALLIQVQEWDEGIEKCSELTDVTLINPVTGKVYYYMELLKLWRHLNV